MTYQRQLYDTCVFISFIITTQKLFSLYRSKKTQTRLTFLLSKMKHCTGIDNQTKPFIILGYSPYYTDVRNKFGVPNSAS